MTNLPFAVDLAGPTNEPVAISSDDAWFFELYEKTFDAIYRFAYMLTRDHHLAEDVVSDAFTRAWHARGRFRRSASGLP